MPCLDIRRTLPGVFLGRQFLSHSSRLGFRKESLQVVDAPATTGPGPATFRQLAGPARLIDADKIDDFPLRNMKAVANGVVEFHDVVLSES